MNYLGPENPPDYYRVRKILGCGHSEEDCDGQACGPPDEPIDNEPIYEPDGWFAPDRLYREGD